ncbi:Mu transposase C-terminal domain-containing protein [Paenibacillus albus]|uniref:Transposase-like Mu C-terminal domain-containing protein n=1 Tax=Paenibacillus albus TaxID=2495582 RepID=A0A3S9A3V2_9BACL|nr:Mu transposase C-terminal domain-containing protein [Paenibacillus albus]AZN40415.1 hypothetical protein EJC50_12705 [Paenibacillus albus]
MTMKEFLRVFHIWLIDYYAQSKSEGVKGVPAKIWERGIKEYGEPDLPASKFDWEIAVMKIDKGTIQKHGVRRDHLYYTAPSLRALQSELESKVMGNSVDIKYDPSDLGKIFVYNPLEKNYLEIPCTNQEYASGLNEYAHKINRKLVDEEVGVVNTSALARAKAKIMDIIFGGLDTVMSLNASRYLGVGSTREIERQTVSKANNEPRKAKVKAKVDFFAGVDMSGEWRTENAARRY